MYGRCQNINITTYGISSQNTQEITLNLEKTSQTSGLEDTVVGSIYALNSRKDRFPFSF